MEVNVNLLAIFLAAVSSMVIGSIWYTPKVFGNYWMKLAKIKPDKNISKLRLAWMYTFAFITSFFTAYVLAHITFLSNKFFGGSFLYSALSTAFWVWLGFIALRFRMHDMFEGRPSALSRLTVWNEAVTIFVMALIIGLMGA